MDAYIFADTATGPAITEALALVPNTARAVLPTAAGPGPELYVAVSDSNALTLIGKIAEVVAIDGLDGQKVYLAYGETSESASFPTYTSPVDDYVGFALIETEPGDTGNVYEAALGTTGVKGAAMVSGPGTVSVIVEGSYDSTGTLDTLLNVTIPAITGVDSSTYSRGPVSGGAGFTT